MKMPLTVGKKFAFYLTEKFSPLGVFGAIEVLRTTNRFLNLEFYSWNLLSIDGNPVSCSSNVTVIPNGTIDDALNHDCFFVCSGFYPERHYYPELLATLRTFDRYGKELGSISTGTQILAKAGVIGKRRCTIHEENAFLFREEFPKIKLGSGIFEIDQKLYTSSGGTSAIDLFITLVSIDHGDYFASQIAQQFQQDRVRKAQEHQSRFKRTSLAIKSKKLALAISLMEANIETPLKGQALAKQVGTSTRQLQRLFLQYTGCSPTNFYLDLRIHHAQLLLLQTTMSILEIAIASGFGTHTHFTKCYKRQFGCTPSMERKKII